MTRRLIINADGFGFTRGINKGIIESIEKGVVSSISCNVNFPYIEEVVYIAKHFPNVSIGLHVNINVGSPVCPPHLVPTLVNSTGEFWGSESEAVLDRKFLLCKLKIREMQLECEAQILKLQSFGINITHLDSHQNKHLYPGYFGVLLKAGRKYGIKRIRCHRKYLFMKDNNRRALKIIQYYLTHPKKAIIHGYSRILMSIAEISGFRMADRLISLGFIDNSEISAAETWVSIIRSLPKGNSEIYCHPGYPDDDLRRYAKYVDKRRLELEVLTSPDLSMNIQEENVQIISFSEI
jgi:chitin disaccharide deacetylase